MILLLFACNVAYLMERFVYLMSDAGVVVSSPALIAKALCFPPPSSAPHTAHLQAHCPCTLITCRLCADPVACTSHHSQLPLGTAVVAILKSRFDCAEKVLCNFVNKAAMRAALAVGAALPLKGWRWWRAAVVGLVPLACSLTMMAIDQVIMVDLGKTLGGGLSRWKRFGTVGYMVCLGALMVVSAEAPAAMALASTV
jgi:hypothetical protein